MNPKRWTRCLLVSAALVPAVAAEELPPGLVLHLDFNRNEDNQVPNLKGPAPHGTGKKARFVPVAGFGHALAVRQNDEPIHYVEVADHPALNGATFTVAAWVCPRRMGVSGSVACKHDWINGGARGFTLRSNKDNRMNFTIGAGGWISADTKSLLRANTWVHVAAAFDGRNVIIYFNGKREDSTEIPKKYTPSPYPLRVGHAAFKLERHRKFDGKIDDLMIWNRCLTPTELQALYMAGKDRRPPPPTAAQVSALVKQLAAERYRTRHAANQDLLDMGPAIIPELEKHMDNPDPEIRVRLQVLTRKLRRSP